jgi:biopterin-dependent aromatic amino acid hydroxylase
MTGLGIGSFAVIWRKLLNDLPRLRDFIQKRIPYPLSRALMCGFCFTYWLSLASLIIFDPLNGWLPPLQGFTSPTLHPFAYLFLSWMLLGFVALLWRSLFVIIQELIGHLPYFTDRKFAAMAHEFGALCRHATPRQKLQISRIWSLGVEFGLVKERGKVKLFGAGLLSSYGETLHAQAMIRKGKIAPFDLREVTKTPGRTYEYHRKYFVLNKPRDVLGFLRAYAKKESLHV